MFRKSIITTTTLAYVIGISSVFRCSKFPMEKIERVAKPRIRHGPMTLEARILLIYPLFNTPTGPCRVRVHGLSRPTIGGTRFFLRWVPSLSMRVKKIVLGMKASSRLQRTHRNKKQQTLRVNAIKMFG